MHFNLFLNIHISDKILLYVLMDLEQRIGQASVICFNNIYFVFLVDRSKNLKNYIRD